MRPDEVIKYRDKPVEYGGSRYILRAARKELAKRDREEQ